MQRCPDCKKKGVSLRLKGNGEDHYKCRYCEFWCFSGGTNVVDAAKRKRLEFENREEKVSVETLEKWFKTLMKVETKLGDRKSAQALQVVVDDIGTLLGYDV